MIMLNITTDANMVVGNIIRLRVDSTNILLKYTRYNSLGLRGIVRVLSMCFVKTSA